jgi:hypothetical protein
VVAVALLEILQGGLAAVVVVETEVGIPLVAHEQQALFRGIMEGRQQQEITVAGAVEAQVQ